MLPLEIEKIIKVLHEKKLSCVILKSDGSIVHCRRRGVIDLYELLCSSPETLNGAVIADKVVGRGAAALMVLGQIKRLYTDVLSRPALQLLGQAGIATDYGTLVDNIINRNGDDICPVEKLTSQVQSAQEALPLIAQFIEDMKNNKPEINQKTE